MRYEILGEEAFPILKIELKQGERLKAESDAMVAMDSDMHLSGSMNGGIVRAVARRFAGESFFLQEYHAAQKPCWAMLGTKIPGTIRPLAIKPNESWRVQKGSFLAAESTVQISARVQGIGKSLFGGEGFFVVQLSGNGQAFLSSYGGIYEIDIAEGEEILVDSGHLVAWPDKMKYSIGKSATSWLNAFLSGEMFAVRFYGPGKVYIQSRNAKTFVGWLLSLLPRPRTR